MKRFCDFSYFALSVDFENLTFVNK